MDKDLKTILEETKKLCAVLMKEDKHFVFAWHLEKAILAYELKHSETCLK